MVLRFIAHSLPQTGFVQSVAKNDTPCNPLNALPAKKQAIPLTSSQIFLLQVTARSINQKVSAPAVGCAHLR
jgi:hypothetical protein